MARLFTDASTSNYASFGVNAIGPLLNGASAVSFHAWVKMVEFNTTSAEDNRIVNLRMTSVNCFFLTFDGTDSNKLRFRGRSVSTDALSTTQGVTANAVGQWISCGVVVDYANDIVRIYRNGVQDVSGSVTFGNTSYTNSADASVPDVVMNNIGIPTVIAHLLDGHIAELSFWTSDIKTVGFAQLAKGYSPPFISPSSLAVYVPFWGKSNPEPNLVGGKKLLITGTVDPSPHPRIIYPRNFR